MKKIILLILWVFVNLMLYVAMMAMDKSSAPHLAFVALRVTLVTSLIMMVLMSLGLVKLDSR